ncbi:MAG: hypothetical protein K0U74_09120 [Alphaproteobacteria bacterium]|nr:hypothetical protein [Alphaproteobacteria bacterium]
MIRTTAIAAALAFVMSIPMGATAVDAGHHYTRKLCKASTLRGKPVTFICQIDQMCCYNKLTKKSSCPSNKNRWGKKRRLCR